MSGLRWTALVLLLLGSAALAHHATAPYYDRSQTDEVEGEITDVRWQNPHVGFTLRSVDANGDEQLWEIETNSVSNVSRFGLTADLVTVGDTVRIAGSPSIHISVNQRRIAR